MATWGSNVAFWQFLEHTIVHRTALYVHLLPFAARILDAPPSVVQRNDDSSTPFNEQEEHVQLAIREALAGHEPAPPPQKSPEVVVAAMTQEISSVLDEYIALTSTIQPSRSPTQIVSDENSGGEPEGIMRLADLARFRAHTKRKDSTQQPATSSVYRPDRSSSSGGGGPTSGGGKRSPPIVIPVLVERTVTGTSPNHEGVGLDRKRSTLSRQRAQYGVGEGQNQQQHHPHHNHPPSKKRPSGGVAGSNVPEVIEMRPVGMVRSPGDAQPIWEHQHQVVAGHSSTVNNVVRHNSTTNSNSNSNNNNNSSSKLITVSVANSTSGRRQSKEKEKDKASRRKSVDSLNDDENIMLLK